MTTATYYQYQDVPLRTTGRLSEQVTLVGAPNSILHSFLAGMFTTGISPSK